MLELLALGAVIYVIATRFLLRNVKFRPVLRYAFCLSAVPIFVALLIVSVWMVSTYLPQLPEIQARLRASGGKGLENLVTFVIYILLPGLGGALWYLLFSYLDRAVYRRAEYKLGRQGAMQGPSSEPRMSFRTTGSDLIAIRETPRSLRAYFILVGTVGVLGNGFQFIGAQNVLVAADAAVGLGLASGFLYSGVKLQSLLQTGGVLINRLIIVTLGYRSAALVLAAFTRAGAGAFIGPAVGIAILLYLRAEVRRLLREGTAVGLP